jgi:hypothetical protein
MFNAAVPVQFLWSWTVTLLIFAAMQLTDVSRRIMARSIRARNIASLLVTDGLDSFDVLPTANASANSSGASV